MKTTPPAQHPLAGSSPVHTRIRGYSSPIAAPGNQRRRAAQRAPTWDAQPAFLCFSLPGQGDWQFPALTTWRTLSFLVITKVPGCWTILWPRDQWCDTAKGSGACESRGQTRHSRYTAYPPAGPRLHVSLLAARARAAQGLPPLRLELPKVTTPRNPASRVCFVCEEGTKHEHYCLQDRRRENVLYCFQEKETGALQFSGEGNWCFTVFRRRKLVLYCFQIERNLYSTVHRRRKLVHSALLFTG